MSTLTQPFIEAINAKEIESAVIIGKSADGSFYHESYHGDRTLIDGTKKPLAETDIIFLASATKIITTIAALQCVERGQVNLKADTKVILPELSQQGILKGFDDKDSPIIEPNTKAITLEHLLTHSSGLVYHFIDPDLMKWRKTNLTTDLTAPPAERMNQPLKFPPGEQWMYGPSSDWAGILVERVSGLQLDEYIRQHILSPLGISSSDMTFFPREEGQDERMVDLNPGDTEGRGVSVTGGTPLGAGTTGAYGGHGAYATPRAVLTVLHSILANDEKLLSKATVEDMFKPHLEEGARTSLKGILANPATGIFGQGTSGDNRDWGLGGIYIGDDGDNGMGKGSLMWGGGVNSTWFIDPKNKLCGFAAPQLGMPPNVPKATELKTGFRKDLHTAQDEAAKNGGR